MVQAPASPEQGTITESETHGPSTPPSRREHRGSSQKRSPWQGALARDPLSRCRSPVPLMGYPVAKA
eukprot:7385008-Prymnesium_polylepis.1